jgi:Ca2+-binding RTX toxin-like protein
LGNTLSVGGAGSILDSYFTNISGFGTLELEGDNILVLGSQASLAGFTRVNVKDGDNSFTISSGGPSGVTLDASSGTGDNRFTFDSVNQFSTSRVLGSDGDDTLAFANQGVIADTLIGRAEGIEVLQLSGTSEVTLGTYAAAAGVVMVNGGTGRTIFTQDSLSTKSYYLDGSADLENGNRFMIAKAGQVANDTLLGGSGIDTLRVETGSIVDSSFANVRAVEVLQLTGSGSVVLGNNADLSGLFSVVGGMGQNQFTHALASDLSYFLDGSLGSNNLFSVADALHASIDTFVGGVGTDTVKIGEDVIDDSAFLNHRFVEVLQLSGTSDVTLGSAAASAGISTVYGGSGATSFDASTMTGSLVIDAGAGSGASFLKAGSGADNITGGSGADTLTGWASDANTATDTLFGGAGADLFVLGDEAGNGYGDGASKAIISDFAGGTDYLQLHDYGTGASSYRVDASAGSGFTHQLFDTNSGSDVLLANINYTGSDAAGDLLGSKALFA